MLVAMWRNGRDGLYLEPGELAALVDLVRRAEPPGAPLHPNTLMLSALAKALSEMTDGPGVLVTPAPAAVVRQAAQAYVRQPTDAPATLNGHTPAGSKSVRPA